MSRTETENSRNINTNGDDFDSVSFSYDDTESVPICPDSRPTEIIAKLQHVYKKLLENLDEDTGIDGLKLKVATLQSWVNDLTEQNTLLVETAEQLEKEAAERVALLEGYIRQTSQAALKYMTKLQDYDSQVQDLADQKINLVSKTLSQEQLQTRISNLQNDIESLLDLIRQARKTGSWTLDGLSFREVVWDDDFVGKLSAEKPQQHAFLELNGSSIPETEDSKTPGNFQSQIALLDAESKIKILEEDAANNKNSVITLQQQFIEKQALLDSTLKENEKLCSQIEAHMKQIALKDKEIETFKDKLVKREKSSMEEKEVLTKEVAEKHDEIKSLTEKNKQLENRCRDANMQTQLKDDIIKQMRKDIKQLKMEIHVSDCNESQKTGEKVDAQIVDDQTRIHITHCITESALEETDQTQVDSLRKELSDAKEEIESLKLNQKSKDQMLANQIEMFKVQQDTLNMTQNELKETQEHLKELENMKQAVQDSAKELKSKHEDEKSLKEALAKAEKRSEEQQLTIKNLQEALLSTKHQLEELQGKGAMEVSVNSGRTWSWLQTPRSNHTTKMVVHDV